MRYRLDADEPLASGLRRALDEELDAAASELSALDPDRFDDAIHEARKSLKKARTALRLMRDVLGGSRYRAANQRLRDAGAVLSSTRDAAVVLETIRGVIAAEAVSCMALATLRARLERELAETRRLALMAGGARDEALERIVAGRADAARWGLGDGLDGHVWLGVRRAYRRGRERMWDARREPAPETLHEWRKRVKDLGYTLDLLVPVWPEILEPCEREVRRLWGLLGDDHDLHVLGVEADSRADAFPTPASLEALHDHIVARRAALQQQAFGLGQRLYAERPKAFVRRLSGYRHAGPYGEEVGS